MSTKNTIQIPPAINSLFQQLQNQNFEGQLALKISDFKGTPFEHLFSLLQCSDSLIIDKIYTNDQERNCNQFSFEGQFSHDLMGKCQWHCQFAIDRDTNSPYIIAGFISVVTPNKLWPWLNSDVFASDTCKDYRLKYNSKSPQKVWVSGRQNESEYGHFLWTIDGKQRTATLELKLQTAFEIKGMFDLSMSDLQGKLNWQKDKDVHGILSGTATFGSKTLPIELAVPSPANELLFTYNNKAKDSFTSIAEIFEALPLGNKLGRLVEPVADLIDGAGIQLNYIQFYVDAYTKQPKSVVVEVQLNKQWEVADGLAFANPTMTLSLGQHISLKKPFWTCQLSTTVKLFNKEFVAKISLPDNTLGFSLADNNTISLTDIASAFGFDNSGMPSIALTDFFISYNLKIEEWTIAAKVNSDLSFNIGDQTLQLVEAGFLLNKSSKLTTCMLYGQMALNGKRCEVKLLNNGMGWTLSANMLDTIPVHSIVESYFRSSGFQLPEQLPTFDINQLNLSYTPSDKAFSFSGTIVNDVSVSIGAEKISLKQLDFKIASFNKVTTGHIKGMVQTSFMNLNVAYDLTKGPVFEATFPDIQLNTLAEKLCGESVMQQIGLPVNFPDFHIKDCKLILSLKDSSVQVSANLDGYTSVLFELRKEQQKWGFIFGAIIGEGFKFKNIADFLEPVDALSLKDSALIISTFHANNYTIPGSQLSGTLDKGLNFFMNLSLNSGKELSMVKKILHLHIDVLQIHMSVGSSANASLEGIFGGNIQLFDGINLTKTGLRLKLQSGILQFSLFVALKVDIGDVLFFEGEITVEPTGATLAATMTGTWEKPFGVEGMSLSDIALAIGFNDVGIPTIGMAGKVKIQKLEGELAVLFNSKMPQQSALKLAFNELYVKSILELCDQSILKTIPEPLEPVLKSGYKDVEIYVVPTATSIGEIKYEQGLRAKGKLNILGWKSELNMEIDPAKGVTAKGMIDPINFLRVFEIKGAGELDKPQIDIALRLDEQKALIAGEMNFLDIEKQALYAKIGSDGAKFSLTQKMYGAVELKLNDCLVSSKGFNAAGQIIFDINSIGPLTIAGNTIINKIDINTHLQMSGSIKIDSIFEFTFNGSLVILEHTLTEINIALTAPPKDFKEVLDMVVEKVKDFVAANFISIWKNIKEFTLFIKDQFVNIGIEIADIAKDVYKATEDDAIEAYKIVGAGAKDIAKGMKEAYKMTEGAITKALLQAKFPEKEVGEALKDVYIVSSDVLAKLFNEAGIPPTTIAMVLMNVYGLQDVKVISLLKAIDVPTDEIAKVLKGAVFNYSIKECAKALNSIKIPIDQISSGLNSAYDASPKVVAGALKGLNYSATEIAHTLYNVFNLDGHDVASVLRGIHFDAEAVGDALEATFRFGKDQIKNLLTEAGYVAGALGKFGSAIADAAKKLWGKIFNR